MTNFIPAARTRDWWLTVCLVAVVSASWTPLRSVRRNQDDAFQTEDGDVVTVMRKIVSVELSNCVLAIVWDAKFSGTLLLNFLTIIPNPKQVVEVDSSGKMSRLLWRGKQCRGYLLLLSDPSPLMKLADQGHHEDWDYSGRFVVAGLSKVQVDAFIRTRKGRKTEHILGIVKSSDRDYYVFTNLLYDKEPTTSIFAWRATTQLPVSALPVRTEAYSSLFPDKTRNMQATTLNVVTFPFPPAVMHWPLRDDGSKQWFGFNIRLVEAVSSVFNFSLRYKETPPGEVWGEITANGSWNGMVGMLGRGEGDIGLASLFITALKGREEFQGYTAPYGQEKTCFLVKMEAPSPKWQSLALPFTLKTWVAVVVLMILAGPLLYILARPALSREKMMGKSFTYSSLYTFGVHFRESQTLVPTRPSLQIFVMFLWMYVIIVTVAYSANLTAFLTVERVPEGITSLKQLFESSLNVYGIGPFFRNNMVQAKNEFVKGLAERFIQKVTYEEIYENLLQGRGVYINSHSHVAYKASVSTSPTGVPILRIIQECFQPFSVAMGLQSHSPLKRNFDRVVTWTVEAGLVQYWFDETLVLAKEMRKREAANNRKVSSKERNAEEEDISGSGQTVSLTMEHLQSVFIVFFVGNVASSFILLVELILAECANRWTETFVPC